LIGGASLAKRAPSSSATLPAGTIIIGWVGIADGGMIGIAVALDVPGENSCELCAETRLLCVQNNTKHRAKQIPRIVTATDVSAILIMQASVLGSNQGEFKPHNRVCRRNNAMLRAFSADMRPIYARRS
jgi:hypothetical protein